MAFDLNYYLFDLWVGDPRTTGFFMISNGPWNLLIIIFSMLYIIHVTIPKYMRDRPAYDLRPLMLVFDSFHLTCYTFGMIISWFYLITDLEESMFYCTPYKPETWNFKIQACIYIGYLYIWAKLIDLIRPMIIGLRKRKEQLSFGQNLLHGYYIFSIYVGLIFRPLGVQMYVPLTDGIANFVIYLYYVITAGGSLYRPYAKMRVVIPYIRIIQFTSIIYHTTITWGCDDIHITLKIMEAVLAVSGFVGSIYYMSKIPKLRTKVD